ncbi:hypothetical protein [Luteolibacter luteus]|uniref:Uncharacterized protein n=1 Tax=Luteolibacter luteus TaxID=2728835 RepID=A0A858RQ73_9BACT|nr:hypothetical protein [Luteolibacter luteus]QJE98499.1 hypothetical protein HHL09_22830 [Luteolibacter luteus]
MARDERWKQVGIGLAVLAGVLCVGLLLVFGRHLPGLAGEFFARILGMVTTPFILETTLCVLGFVIVMTLNYWRQWRDGDELVYLDEVKNPPESMPDQAKWAVYKDKPLEPGVIAPADLLEGSIAIGDHEAAIEILTSMSDAERSAPEVLKLRITLAEASGKTELAAQLRAQLGKAGV